MSRRHALTALTLAGLLAAGAAHAGSAANAQAAGRLAIADSAGYSWQLDFAPLLSVDASSGNLVVNTAAAAGGLSDAQGYWSTSANTGQLTVKTAAGAVYTPSTVITWHSWLRADGTVGTDTAGGTNPWRSSFSFYAAGNVDPEMSYGFAVRNNTAATQTYTYTQGESLVPGVAGGYSIYADIGGAVSNVTTSGTPGLALGTTAANGGKVQQVWLGQGNSAVANAGVGVGDGLTTAAAGSTNYGSFATTAAGAGGYDYWEFQTRFTLSGGRDLAALTGYAQLTPVPEPSSYLLLAAGLAFFGLRIRRTTD